MTADRAAAARARRYRQRQRSGAVVAPCEIAPFVADALVQAGFLDLADLEDRQAVAEAATRALAAWAARIGAGRHA